MDTDEVFPCKGCGEVGSDTLGEPRLLAGVLTFLSGRSWRKARPLNSVRSRVAFSSRAPVRVILLRVECFGLGEGGWPRVPWTEPSMPRGSRVAESYLLTIF